MNKKGFTLVELLATIVVLAIIMGIGTSATLSVLQKNKEKMLEIKKKSILESAVIYGQEELQNVTIGNDCVTGKFIYVSDLIDGDYLKTDNGKMINDVTGQDMKNVKICIYRKNNRITADFAP